MTLNQKAALGYLRNGFSVIPVNGKVPLIKWQEFTEKPPTEEQIMKWWEEFPDANVGIITGKISGLIVMDVDSEEGYEVLKSKNVPQTLTAITAKGKHLYFKHPGFPVQSSVRILPGIDIRGEHGFVVAPPSKHPSGVTYRWESKSNQMADLPSWFQELLTTGQPAVQSSTTHLPDVLDGVPEGQRDNALFKYACRLRAKNLDKKEAEKLMLEAANNCKPPFPEKETLLKLEQAWKYSPGMASSVVSQFGNRVVVTGTERMVHVAWPDRGLHADVSGLKQHTDGTISGILEIKNTAPGIPVIIHSKSLFNFSKPRVRSELIRNLNERLSGVEWATIVDELCDRVTNWVSEGESVIDLSEISAHEPEYLLYPLLLKNEPVVFVGQRGSTKSYLALWIATILSSGVEPNDSRLFVREKVRVLYLDYEQSEDNMAWRLECIANGLAIKKPKIYYRRCSRPLNTDTEQIKKIILDYDIGLVVIDSLGPASGGDINSAQVALEFHNALRSLRTSALIIAHPPKAGSGIIGSQFYEAMARSIFELRIDIAPGDSSVSVGFIHRKCNFGKLETPLGFRVSFEKGVTKVTPEDARLMAALESEWSTADRIMELVDKHGEVTVRSVATALGVTHQVAREKLSSLERKGQLEQTSTGSYIKADSTVPF